MSKEPVLGTCDRDTVPHTKDRYSEPCVNWKADEPAEPAEPSVGMEEMKVYGMCSSHPTTALHVKNEVCVNWYPVDEHWQPILVAKPSHQRHRSQSARSVANPLDATKSDWVNAHGPGECFDPALAQDEGPELPPRLELSNWNHTHAGPRWMREDRFVAYANALEAELAATKRERDEFAETLVKMQADVAAVIRESEAFRTMAGKLGIVQSVSGAWFNDGGVVWPVRVADKEAELAALRAKPEESDLCVCGYKRMDHWNPSSACYCVAPVWVKDVAPEPEHQQEGASHE